MAVFRVTEIIDGNTIRVAGWVWSAGSYQGTKVKIAGYTTSPASTEYGMLLKNRLTNLLLGKDVELKNVTKADKGIVQKDDILYCSVYLNDVDISKYFPELKQT